MKVERDKDREERTDVQLYYGKNLEKFNTDRIDDRIQEYRSALANADESVWGETDRSRWQYLLGILLQVKRGRTL